MVSRVAADLQRPICLSTFGACSGSVKLTLRCKVFFTGTGLLPSLPKIPRGSPEVAHDKNNIRTPMLRGNPVFRARVSFGQFMYHGSYSKSESDAFRLKLAQFLHARWMLCIRFYFCPLKVKCLKKFTSHWFVKYWPFVVCFFDLLAENVTYTLSCTKSFNK